MLPILITIAYYVILFLAVFIESFPVIGTLIPGGVIVLFFAGVLSKIGILDLWTTLIVCYIASVTIDFWAYHLGNYHGEKFIHKYSKYVLVKKEFIHKIADLIIEHPIKVLGLGKFNPATRAMGPFMAGMKSLKYSVFFWINLINSALWVVITVLLGYFFGHGLEAFKLLQNSLLAFGVILFTVAYVAFLIIEYKKGKILHKE